MNDRQIFEDHFISFDYTKPEENEKRYTTGQKHKKKVRPITAYFFLQT